MSPSWFVKTRELEIPLEGEAPSRQEIAAALERMGCLVPDALEGAITGYLSGSPTNWGQEVRVTTERDRLRVRSFFSRYQIFGAGTNQANVERFRAEWARRAEFRPGVAAPAVVAAAQEAARTVARRAAWSGGLVAAAGLALILLALLVPERSGAPSGSRWRLAGLASLPLLYGLPRALAGLERLRRRSP